MKKTIVFSNITDKEEVLNRAYNLGWQAYTLNELAIRVVVPKEEATSLAILLILYGGNFSMIK